MAVLKLSQIAAAAGPPAVTDQAVFVTGGATDNLITVTQLAAGLPVFTSTARGSVPASGGVATTFLNGAGAFTTPSPGGVSPQLQFNNAGVFGGASGTSWDNSNLALTITGATITANNPLLNLTQTWNNPLVAFTAYSFNANRTANLGTSKLFNFTFDGSTVMLSGDSGGNVNIFSLTVTNGSLLLSNAGSNVTIQSGGSYIWAGSVVLSSEAAGIVAQSNSTNAMTLRVYNTRTDASNFERGVFDWQTNSNVLTIGTQSLGTGTARGLAIATAGTNAITVSSAQLVALPAITTDATHTDSTICQDTTTHALYFGSGAAGICLGTSSIRYKHAINDLDDGLSQILALRPITYRYNHQPDQDLYGFTAEDVVDVIPRLVRPDKEGRPNSVDHIGMLAVIVNAIKEQQIMIEELKDQLDELSTGKH